MYCNIAIGTRVLDYEKILAIFISFFARLAEHESVSVAQR